MAREGVVIRAGALGENRYNLQESIKNYIRRLREIATGKSTHDEGAVQRARWVKEKANQAELTTQKMAGEFVRRAEALEAMESEYSLVKERLLTLPGKVADRCVGRTRREIFEMLTSEIYEALEELSSSEFESDRKSA